MIQSNENFKYVACCICQSRTTHAHRLPALSTKEEKLLRYAKWVNFAAIENVYTKKKYYWICENHFEDSAFCNHLKLKILQTSVPTLNPPIYEYDEKAPKASIKDEGPCTEDGSPPGPTEPKDETLQKIFKEVVNRQRSNKPVVERRKFYNFIPASPRGISFAAIIKEKENHLRSDIQSSHQAGAFLKQDSKQVSADQANDAVSLPMIKAVVSSPNFKTTAKTSNSSEKPDCIKKDSSFLISSFLSQRRRPLILKKSPSSCKIIQSSSADVSDFLKTLSNADSSVQVSESDDCPTNPESASCRMEIVEKNNKKPEDVDNDLPEILKSAKKSSVDNVVSTTTDHLYTKNYNLSSLNENNSISTDSVSSVVNSTTNEKEEQFDILSTAINNSDIFFSDISCLDEEVVCGDKVADRKHSHSLKSVKKQPVFKKKYYDPVLIDSVLNKMKLKKNGPVCVVTLEKKPDRLFKGFSKSKLVTLYKQQIKKNRKNKKVNQGTSKNANDITKKVRKKRWCTCSIHCHKKLNGSKSSSPVVNINPGVGVKFEGRALNPNVMNIDPDLADEELFNVESVFNVSTILTNVHDKSQIEQLCQMLIESIFRLKSINVEGTMAKLEVYLSQVPERRVDRSAGDETSSTCKFNETAKSNNSSQNIEVDHDVVSNTLKDQEVILSSFQESDCNQISSFINLTSDKEIPLYNEVPVTPAKDIANASNPQTRPKNVKVRLSTFHDHSYVKRESNYIFEKPEYLVKLINIETYRCPRKTSKPPQSGISNKVTERNKKACLKLNNRIMRLRELIKKKNENIKTMNRKIKYLGGIVCQEKGIKRVKYPKEQEKQIDSLNICPEDDIQMTRRDEAKMLIDVNIDQLRMDNAVSINSFDSTPFFEDNAQIKTKKANETKTKKNATAESFDVLYENLIEELCCNEMEY